MASPRPGFVRDVQTLITQELGFADGWSALKAEFDTFTTNGVAITQADVNKVFGTSDDDPPVPIVTLAQFNQALAAQQSVVDFAHSPAVGPKLYRIKR